MAYCANCRTEFQSSVKVCTDCGAELSATAPKTSEEAFVEVFSTDNREDIVTAQKVLEDASVDHFVRDLEGGAFPTHMGTQAERRLAVSASQLDVAHALIKEAIEDGAISTRGALLA